MGEPGGLHPAPPSLPREEFSETSACPGRYLPARKYQSFINEKDKTSSQRYKSRINDT